MKKFLCLVMLMFSINCFAAHNNIIYTSNKIPAMMNIIQDPNNTEIQHLSLDANKKYKFTKIRRGCCSWHGGVDRCSSKHRLICRDGTYSPSCGC